MAGTTTNFGFDYPTSTDYVKDGATAIQELADDVDARFGDDANYPDQIVNVVSGVSRPLPFATAAGTGSAVFTASTSSSNTITFPASRFTQAPLVLLTNTSAAGAMAGATFRALSTSTASFTLAGTANSSATTTAVINYVAIQMKSATAAG